MAKLIPVKVPWTKKPPLGHQLEVDWENPITRGLWVAGGHGNSNRDLTKKHQINVDTAQRGIGGGIGRCAQSSQATAGKTAWDIDKTELADKVTCLSVFNMRTTTGNPLTPLIGVNRPGFLSFELQRRSDSGGNPRRIIFRVYNGTSAISADGSTENHTNVRIVQGRYDGANVTCWTAGKQIASSALTGNIFQNQDIAQTTGNHTATTATDANIYLSLIWLRALTDEEMKSIGRNPWQIYKPRVVWLPVPVAAAGITGTAASTNADDTQAAAGTLEASGAASSTNADDTQAAAGELTNSGVAASANADDSQVAAGTLEASGSAASTNADDTQVAAGELTNSGAAASTNADDTQVAAGVVTTPGITGSAASTNADDTQAAVGQLTASGAASSTNASDIQVASGIVGAIILEPGRIFTASLPLRTFKASLPIRTFKAAV